MSKQDSNTKTLEDTDLDSDEEAELIRANFLKRWPNLMSKEEQIRANFLLNQLEGVPYPKSDETLKNDNYNNNNGYFIKDYDTLLKWIYKIIPECKQFKDSLATSLSGGQQKLVALARALMVGKTLLLLDEPTEGIAPVLAQRMGEILASLKKEGVSIIIAESNDAHVADVIDRTYVIERGSIVGV